MKFIFLFLLLRKKKKKRFFIDPNLNECVFFSYISISIPYRFIICARNQVIWNLLHTFIDQYNIIRFVITVLVVFFFFSIYLVISFLFFSEHSFKYLTFLFFSVFLCGLDIRNPKLAYLLISWRTYHAELIFFMIVIQGFLVLIQSFNLEGRNKENNSFKTYIYEIWRFWNTKLSIRILYLLETYFISII